VGLPTRNSTGVGAEIWFGIGSISIGSNNTTPTISYTNSANTSSRTATLKQGTVVAGSQSLYTMIPMNLQNGDLGVKSIQSLTLSANAGAVGSIYLYIMQPVATIQLPVANLGNVRNAFELNLPQIDDSSCLIFVSQSSTTTTGVIMGQISIVQG
jgi:hypothetical protein